MLSILAEGERDGDIEILTVDVANGRVSAIQHGTQVALTFQRGGVSIPGSLPTHLPPFPSP